MFLPYRAKNPPEHFPVATITLICLNVLIFALTSEYFLVARRDVVQDFALSHNTLSPLRLFTSIFLHGDLVHLASNMLALWLFGASVEGRLRPLKYLLVYFVAGLAGGLLHDVTVGIARPDQFALGASGAIMGLSGAYLYMFPYSTICIFYLFYFRAGVAEWQARWLVLLYVAFDILYAILLQGASGVGHFAHLGGFGTGLLVTMLMRPHRDSEDVSAVQATHAEAKDYSLLSLSELETLMERPTEDMRLVTAYLEKAVQHYGGSHPDRALSILNKFARPLMEQGEFQRLAYVLLHLPVSAGGLHPSYYLRLASRLEAQASNDLASQLYRRVYDLAPNTPDAEAALFRLGQLMQNVFLNHAYAQSCYQEQLRLFPNGEMSLQARQALQKMQAGVHG